MRYFNLLLVVLSLCGLARAAAAEETFNLDLDLHYGGSGTGNGAYASSYGTGESAANARSNKGFGVSLGYALPHETGEWRIAAGLANRVRFDFNDAPAGATLSPAGQGDDPDSQTAMVTLFYTPDLGERGLFGMNLRPYIGGGIGITRGLTGLDGTGNALPLNEDFDSDGSYDVTWGMTAGVTLPLTENLNLSLSYRYVDLGQTERAGLSRDRGSSENQYESHDLMLIFGFKF